MHNKSLSLMAILCVLAAWATPTRADPVTQTSSHGTSDSWDTAGKWSDSLAPHADADYVNNNAAYLTRTPTTASPTFGGKSLTISNGATLVLKATGTTTINNLVLGATTVSQTSGSQTWAGSRLENGSGATTLAGTIAITGTGTVTFDSQVSNRKTTISALVTADSTVSTIVVDALQTPLTTSNNTTSGFILTNAANTFTGTWDVKAGMLKGTGLGQASFNVEGLGYLDFDSDYSNGAGTLTIADGGKLLLDQNLTFGSVSIAGTSLAAGTYTGSELMGSHASAFADGSLGAATITVTGAIPEPSTYAVLLGVGVLVAGLARRCRCF